MRTAQLKLHGWQNRDPSFDRDNNAGRREFGVNRESVWAFSRVDTVLIFNTPDEPLHPPIRGIFEPKSRTSVGAITTTAEAEATTPSFIFLLLRHGLLRIYQYLREEEGGGEKTIGYHSERNEIKMWSELDPLKEYFVKKINRNGKKKDFSRAPKNVWQM